MGQKSEKNSSKKKQKKEESNISHNSEEFKYSNLSKISTNIPDESTSKDFKRKEFLNEIREGNSNLNNYYYEIAKTDLNSKNEKNCWT